MASHPTRPGEKPEIDEETRAILDERLKTIDLDASDAVDYREALAEIRRNLKAPAPR